MNSANFTVSIQDRHTCLSDRHTRLPGSRVGQKMHRSNDCFCNVACLGNIADLLKGLDRSINIILLKGIALLNTVYSRDVSQRHLGDLDILIRIKDFAALKAFLTDKGYIFYNNFNAPRQGSYLNSATCAKQERFWPPFHVHWHLANATFPTAMFSTGIDLEKIWREAGLLDGYENVWIMSAHHQLIHLCEHALKHAYDRPYFLKDIDDLVRYYRGILSWERVISEARAFTLSRPVYYSLYFAKNFLSTEVPSKVISALKPERAGIWERRFVRAVLKGRNTSHLSLVVYLAMNKTFFEKLRFLFRSLIMPPGVSAGINNRLPRQDKSPDRFRRAYGRFRIYIRMARSLII